jgi:hypothetical protein
MTYVEGSAPTGLSSTLIESRAQTAWDQFPTSYNANGQTVSWTRWYYYVDRSEQYAYSAFIRLKSGFSKSKVGNGWGSTYTTPLPGGLGDYRSYNVGNMEEYVNATNGSNTTGFGQTWVGGAGGAAGSSTVSNISVTPGQTYTIVNNGSLVITY